MVLELIGARVSIVGVVRAIFLSLFVVALFILVEFMGERILSVARLLPLVLVGVLSSAVVGLGRLFRPRRAVALNLVVSLLQLLVSVGMVSSAVVLHPVAEVVVFFFKAVPLLFSVF